jgi:hypothetical protein
MTKIIMTKQEILQNNKIDEENHVFSKLYAENKKNRIKGTHKKQIRQIGANFLFDVCRVFLFL